MSGQVLRFRPTKDQGIVAIDKWMDLCLEANATRVDVILFRAGEVGAPARVTGGWPIHVARLKYRGLAPWVTLIGRRMRPVGTVVYDDSGRLVENDVLLGVDLRELFRKATIFAQYAARRWFEAYSTDDEPNYEFGAWVCECLHPDFSKQRLVRGVRVDDVRDAPTATALRGLCRVQ